MRGTVFWVCAMSFRRVRDRQQCFVKTAASGVRSIGAQQRTELRTALSSLPDNGEIYLPLLRFAWLESATLCFGVKICERRSNPVYSVMRGRLV